MKQIIGETINELCNMVLNYVYNAVNATCFNHLRHEKYLLALQKEEEKIN